GVELADQTVGTLQLQSSDALLGRTICGLLGYDFFIPFVVEIDYGAKKINLYDSRSYQYPARAESIAITIDGNLPYVRARITMPEGKTVEGTLLVDTGTSYFLELNRSFIERYRLLARIHQNILPSPSARSQDEQVSIAAGKSLQLGGF